MKTKDQLLLEQAYETIFNKTFQKNTLHEAFLIESGILDKTKQFAGNILNKAKSMFGSSVEKLLGIIQKANPTLFKQIQQAVQQKNDKALQAIFNAPEVKQQQQVQAESFFLGEGVADFIKNTVAKAEMFAMKNPKLASTLALAGILGAITASGPDAMSHLAGFLVQTGGKALGGAAVGGAIGGAVGAVRGGWEGAKQGFKTGAKIGAGVGLASGTQDVMAHGAANIDDIFSNMISSVSPEEAAKLTALKNKATQAGIDAEDTQSIADVFADKTMPTADKIDYVEAVVSSKQSANQNAEVSSASAALGGAVSQQTSQHAAQNPQLTPEQHAERMLRAGEKEADSLEQFNKNFSATYQKGQEVRDRTAAVLKRFGLDK